MASKTDAALLQTTCPKLKLLARGKVRDIYELEQGLLFVATDRVSAFDVIMTNGIPGKGKILTQLSVFWFELLREHFPNHLITAEWEKMPAEVKEYRDQLEGRSMLVRKLPVLPVEAIVRGYITGSGWQEYVQQGTVCDIPLPKNMQEFQKLPEPLYTPSTKATQGNHDMNVHPDKVARLVGDRLAKAVADSAVLLYTKASEYAAKKGIIIADTKFELGTDALENLVLIDEALTPDSSRFWLAADHKAGVRDSYDKQVLRDYLLSIKFDKTTPVEIPQDVIQKVLDKYTKIYRLLTDKEPVM